MSIKADLNMFLESNDQNKKDDFIKDTEKHKKLVKFFMDKFADEIKLRALLHDNSKLEEPELTVFAKNTAILKDLKYGSKEYKEAKKLLPLDQHYKNNKHHPEHFEMGINGMTFVDIIEMFCDWAASSQRTKEGNVLDSIEFNKEKFKMSDQLISILKNSIGFFNYGV